MPDGYWQRWTATAAVTAAVAILDGEVVGTVPFHLRDFLVRPGVPVRAAWEFSVCVREDLRDKGVGSGLMRAAKQFLRGRCQAMMVYREDERSPAYRYYCRNGHHDMAYLRPWVRQGALDIGAEAVDVLGWDEFLHHEAAFLEVFHSAYGAYGGYPPRHGGYYGPATDTPQYAEVPLALTALASRDGAGILRGYAILGEERLNPALHLMEIAARDSDATVALSLLTAHARMAADRGLPAVASMLDSSPYAPALRVLGFTPRPRSDASMMVMMHPLDPEGLASAAWQESEATAALEVAAFTPEREVVLHRATRGPAKRVLLEMKEEALARMLVSRLDLSAAIAHETVTAIGANAADIDAIAQALPYTAWAYHYLDFV